MTGNLLSIIIPDNLKSIAIRFKNYLGRKAFRPYIKKRVLEGIAFDFLIGDFTGQRWYDVFNTDPVWLELGFQRDNLVKPGDIVLECGGHHGCSAILLSKWVGTDGRVISFEPVPENAAILRKNIKLNSLTNVTVEQKAVGDRRGKTLVPGYSFASVFHKNGNILAEMVPIDDYSYLKPTVLKIDVEGFEVEALKGAQKVLGTKPKLAIEIHTDLLINQGRSARELFHLIDTKQYTWWVQWDDRVAPEKFDPDTAIDKRVHVFGIPK